MVEVKVKSMMMNRAKSRCYLSLVLSFIFSLNVCRIIAAKLQNLTTEGAHLFIFVKSSGKTKEMQKMTTYVGNVEVSVSHHSNTPLNRGQPILRAK